MVLIWILLIILAVLIIAGAIAYQLSDSSRDTKEVNNIVNKYYSNDPIENTRTSAPPVTYTKPKTIPANKIVCPACRSVDVEFVGNNKKGFSVGKAVGGAVLLGPIGAGAGFIGKKGKKNDWHCKECGNFFER